MSRVDCEDRRFRGESLTRGGGQFVRESSRGFGEPDYRSTSIEMCSGRLPRRVISVTSLHSNDRVPVYLHGDSNRQASVVRDTYSPAPSTLGTLPPLPVKYRVATSVDSPYVGKYRYQKGTSEGPNPLLRNPARYRDPSPMRYSVTPRFRSRFHQ